MNGSLITADFRFYNPTPVAKTPQSCFSNLGDRFRDEWNKKFNCCHKMTTC